MEICASSPVEGPNCPDRGHVPGDCAGYRLGSLRGPCAQSFVSLVGGVLLKSALPILNAEGSDCESLWPLVVLLLALPVHYFWGQVPRRHPCLDFLNR